MKSEKYVSDAIIGHRYCSL